MAALPRQVALDLQAHLKRQANEGALAYSASALTDAQKSIPFNTVLKHSFALRRECDTFASIFSVSRLLSDQLHVAFSQASEHYKKKKIIDESLLQAVEEPTPLPVTGEVLFQWVPPSPPLECPPDDGCVLVALICPLGEDPAASSPFMARSEVLQKATLRNLFRSFCDDLDHCRPAVSVTGQFLQERLRTLIRSLRRVMVANIMDALPELEEEVESALLKLLSSLQDDAAESAPVGEDVEAPPLVLPQLVSATKAQKLLRAIISLLDVGNHAARINHPEFSCFLRKLLAPQSVF
jgi:hypothetical protein